MDIIFKNSKLEKSFNEGAQLDREHGSQRAKMIRRRMKVLRAAANLKDLWPPYRKPDRCHEISKGKDRIELSVDLDHPYRLIFTPNHDPIPTRPEGGLDWELVTCIVILGVEDTHE